MVEQKRDDIILSIPSAVTCLKKPRSSTFVHDRQLLQNGFDNSGLLLSSPTCKNLSGSEERSLYLGGNHTIKLLFSVDGDLDPKILCKLSAVPTVVGELALSVESLVSHDLTVGGFENDVLAKIASNTLVAKHQATEIQTKKPEGSRRQAHTIFLDGFFHCTESTGWIII